MERHPEMEVLDTFPPSPSSTTSPRPLASIRYTTIEAKAYHRLATVTAITTATPGFTTSFPIPKHAIYSLSKFPALTRSQHSELIHLIRRGEAIDIMLDLTTLQRSQSTWRSEVLCTSGNLYSDGMTADEYGKLVHEIQNELISDKILELEDYVRSVEWERACIQMAIVRKQHELQDARKAFAEMQGLAYVPIRARKTVDESSGVNELERYTEMNVKSESKILEPEDNETEWKSREKCHHRKQIAWAKCVGTNKPLGMNYPRYRAGEFKVKPRSNTKEKRQHWGSVLSFDINERDSVGGSAEEKQEKLEMRKSIEKRLILSLTIEFYFIRDVGRKWANVTQIRNEDIFANGKRELYLSLPMRPQLDTARESN